MRKIIVFGSLLLPLSAAALLNLEFQVPGLGAQALAAASVASGLQLSASDFRLRPLQGLSVRDVAARARFPGGSYRLTIASLNLDYRIVPLFRRVLEFERVVLERPRLEFSWDVVPTEPTQPGNEDSGIAGVTRSEPVQSDPSAASSSSSTTSAAPVHGFSTELEISELTFSDGTILLQAAGEEAARASLEGLSGVLSELDYDARALTPFHGLDARGPLSFDALQLDALRMEAARGTVMIMDGEMELSDFRFRTEYGSFQSEWRLNFNTLPFRYQIELSGALKDVNPLASGNGSEERGEATFQLSAQGFGTDASKLAGEGTLGIPRGFLRSSELTRELDAVVSSSLVGTVLEASTSSFDIVRGQLTLEALELTLPAQVLVIAGEAQLDGRLAMTLHLETPRTLLSVGSDVSFGMAHAERDDWLVVPYLLTGTLTEPMLTPDRTPP